jgi:hypothetical protein
MEDGIKLHPPLFKIIYYHQDNDNRVVGKKNIEELVNSHALK